MNLIKLHRVSHFLYRKGIPVLPQLFRYLIFLLFNSDVPPSVIIGKNTVFGHGGIGVVLHSKTVIGDYCTLGQGITIGGKSRHPDVPVIGNHVYIAAGARILGDIKIGNHVFIAANAVVVKNVGDRCLVGGVPAKIIKEGINIEDYI
ncbi:MAG: serine acetyltransferase [Saprospiraceae bacterium]|nr:serine acetyltransferase [Saprospiraceae bacterium]